MTNIQTRNESAKGAVHATTVEEKKYTFSDNCTAAQKEDLLQILDSNFIAHMNFDEVLETMDEFFLALIESEDMDDNDSRTDFILFYRGTIEFLNELKEWTTQGKDKDRLVEIAIEYYGHSHLEDNVKWMNEMFREHYLAGYTDGGKREARWKVVFFYEEFSKTITVLKDWCNGVYDEMKKKGGGPWKIKL